MESSLLQGKNILLGVTGSIAAYKAAELASSLVKLGADVHVIMTAAAEKFVSPITFETLTSNKVLNDTFDRNSGYHVAHIRMAEEADLVMIAPATANCVAKLCHGIADDMLTSTMLAVTAPVYLAPAMNTRMYENPATRDNLALLAKRGYHIIEPDSGYLACGAVGRGKMPEPSRLLRYIVQEIAFEKDLTGRRILITAGPTREALDPVRFITNHSTGKMGYALAANAAARGALVTLITGPSALAPPDFVTTIPVSAAEEMYAAVMENASDQDVIIMAAAVADYRPAAPASGKLKKTDQEMSLPLVRTKDILASLGARKGSAFLCGFSMETENLIENSAAKLRDKNLDMIVANDLRTPGAGFGADTNEVTILTPGYRERLPLASKELIAAAILDRIKNSL